MTAETSPLQAGAATTVRAICCHCSARCGVLVQVGQDRLPSAIQGDPSHPVSQGFLCPRGQAAVEYFRQPGRVNLPLQRLGERGEGRWREITWDQALDEIAERLLRLRDESGAETLAYLCGTFHGADANFAYRLMHQFGSPNSGGIGLICGGPGYVAESLTFGFGPVFPDVRPGVTGTVLLWANHPSASAPQSWGRIREAMRQGARLVVVDVRPSLESRLADLWLQPRPGTDAALALGMLHVILAEERWDRAFVERWTLGLEALRVRVADYPPERVQELSGVPAEDVRRAARLYADAPAAAIVSGAPNGMGRNALNFERGRSLLIALTGNLDRPGGNRLPGPIPGLGSKTSGERYEALPPAQRCKRLGAQRFRLHDEGMELLSAASSRVWHGIRYPYSVQFWAQAHPPSIFRAILTRQPYPVRALLVQHNNVLGCYGDSQAAYQALRSPNLELSVVHELTLTPTAMLADFVLPAASWMEKPFLWSTGRGDRVMSGAQVLEPLHQRRSDYDLCRDLGRRLGQQWADRVEDVWTEWLDAADTTFDTLVQREQPWLPTSHSQTHHLERDPESGEPLGFGTLSGKVELASGILERLGYDPLPSFDTRGDEQAGDPVEYPLRLLTGNTRIDATHQDHRQVPSLRARHPDPILEIDPTLAARHGIREGDWVRLEAPHGAFRQRAHLVAGLGDDRVNAERWWYPEREAAEPSLFGFWASNVNGFLEADLEACDPAYGTLPFRVARCRIRREEPGE